jgi:hypothetical protein
MAFTMACPNFKNGLKMAFPNFKNGLKMAFGPLGVNNLEQS